VKKELGSRYGKKIRERVKKATSELRKRHACPQCGKKSVKRVGFALWKCKSCKIEFAGGAYSPETTVGSTARKIIEAISEQLKQAKQTEA